MHPELAAALGRLDAVTGDLRAAAAAIETPLRGQKPSAERWCVNEVLEHIGLVEQLFVKALVANIDAAKSAGLTAEVDAPPTLPDHLLTVIEDRSSRRTAPDRVVPTGQIDATVSLQTIEAVRAQLREAIASAMGSRSAR